MNGGTSSSTSSGSLCVQTCVHAPSITKAPSHPLPLPRKGEALAPKVSLPERLEQRHGCLPAADTGAAAAATLRVPAPAAATAPCCCVLPLPLRLLFRSLTPVGCDDDGRAARGCRSYQAQKGSNKQSAVAHESILSHALAPPPVAPTPAALALPRKTCVRDLWCLVLGGVMRMRDDDDDDDAFRPGCLGKRWQAPQFPVPTARASIEQCSVPINRPTALGVRCFGGPSWPPPHTRQRERARNSTVRASAFGQAALADAPEKGDREAPTHLSPRALVRKLGSEPLWARGRGCLGFEQALDPASVSNGTDGRVGRLRTNNGSHRRLARCECSYGCEDKRTAYKQQGLLRQGGFLMSCWVFVFTLRGFF